jgi:hypothetical protein
MSKPTLKFINRAVQSSQIPATVSYPCNFSRAIPIAQSKSLQETSPAKPSSRPSRVSSSPARAVRSPRAAATSFRRHTKPDTMFAPLLSRPHSLR